MKITDILISNCCCNIRNCKLGSSKQVCSLSHSLILQQLGVILASQLLDGLAKPVEIIMQLLRQICKGTISIILLHIFVDGHNKFLTTIVLAHIHKFCIIHKLQQKHPRLRELRELRSRNELFLAFLIRIVGILPCDVVSLYLGNTRLPFPKYLLGGVLGFLPDVLTATVVGMKANDRSSPWFWGAIAVNLLVAGGSTLFYALYRKRQAAAQAAPVSDTDAGETD